MQHLILACSRDGYAVNTRSLRNAVLELRTLASYRERRMEGNQKTGLFAEEFE